MEPERRVKIGIAGTGLGGLAAACRLAQDGHDVEVFERKDFLSTASGSIYVQSNAVRCIQRWGLAAAFQAVTTEIGTTQIRDGYTNELLAQREYSKFSEVPIWASDREALQNTFYEIAQQCGAKISFGISIEDIKETHDQAIATCKDGKILSFDLFIAADGIRSHLRSKILPQFDSTGLAPVAAPSTIFPTEILKDALLGNDLTQSIVCGEYSENSLVFTGNGGYVVAKYNHSRQLLNLQWCIKHEVGSEEEKNPRLFDEDGDPEQIRAFYSSWAPMIRALAGMTHSCSRWRLAGLEPLDTWTSAGSRLLLMGDSAHAMLPDIAQGFSSIIEDVEILSIMLNTSRMSVQEAVRLWERARVPRVKKLQRISQHNHDCFNRGIAPVVLLTNEQRNLPVGEGDADAPFNSPPFMRWMYNYDAAREVSWVAKENPPFPNTDQLQAYRYLAQLDKTRSDGV